MLERKTGLSSRQTLARAASIEFSLFRKVSRTVKKHLSHSLGNLPSETDSSKLDSASINSGDSGILFDSIQAYRA